jgi:hypothetical protein
METHDRREDAVLYPAHCKLFIFDAQHMASDIIAPPSISDIRCSIGEFGLKIEDYDTIVSPENPTGYRWLPGPAYLEKITGCLLG